MKTILLVIFFGDEIIDRGDQTVYKIISMIFNPIQAYIYLKFCYAVYLMYMVQAALRCQDLPILLQ